MQTDKKTIQAPPWVVRLMTPMIARIVARQMIKKYPGLGADDIIARMRAESGQGSEAERRMLEAVALRLPANPAAEAQRDAATTWRSPSSLVLIAANLLPLYGVLVFDWPVFPVMLLFWLENVVIGVLNALRMLLADPTDLALWGAKLFMVPFFCFHYGMFTAIHGSFVVSLFGGKEYGRMDQGLVPVEGALRAVTDFGVAPALAVLAGSHVFSLLWNYLIGGEFRRVSLSEQMGQPYKRVIVLHLTIIFGGGIAMALGSPVWALLALIALKIGFDLNAHIKEHAKLAV
ncbi:MAG: hypothetical protein IH605_18235 [Burkholderiales bacterium]|nr:hypothetical protein [Burkholderiales bacterium]